MIGTTINKVFEDGESEEVCTDLDIVMLKQALLKDDPTGAYYPKDDPILHHREWLIKLVENIEGNNVAEKRKKHISFLNSITEISTTAVDDIENYDKEFIKGYYGAITKNEYITFKDKQLCYGILTGNDNYARLPESEVLAVLKKGYSNNKTEISFAVPKSIVFLKKHYPFPVNPSFDIEKVSSIAPEEIIFIQYIHEMCGCLYIDRQLDRLSRLFETGRSAKIKKGLSIMSKIIGTKLFRITEAEKRAEYIYELFGLREEYENLKERGILLADAIDIKYSKFSNFSIISLTILTVLIGFAQISNKNQNTITDISNHNIMIANDFTLTNYLLILILISLVTITCLIAFHITRNRRKDDDLF